MVTPSTSQSWIGKTVKLTCTADGAPTPALSWKNARGKVIKKVRELKNTVDVLMKSDQDFGKYTCEATNVVNTDTSTVQVQQIKTPGSPTFTVDIEATSITVNWTKPADDGGSPITAYRVLILLGNTEIQNTNITDLTAMQLDIGGLTKSTNYIIKLFARNYVFEGNAAERKIQTKYEGVPGAAEITDLPAETKNVNIILKWKEAENNGAPITQYTVYRKTVREDGTSLNWIKIKEITDTSDRKVVVSNFDKGKEYELVVTATNKFGEGGKEERKIRKIKVLGGAPSAVAFIYELNADEITLKWEEPNDNGAEITMYTVYYGTLNDEQWKETKKITDVSVRKYVVKVVMGKKYKVLVTASNKYGESSKEGKIQLVDVLEGFSKPTASQTAGSSCDNQKETLHAVYITIICLLLISNLILIFFVCRMRTLSGKWAFILKALNPIAVKVEADTQSFDVERTFEAPTFSTTASADYMPLHPSTRNWEISRRQVNIITVIGKGAFSQVAKATVNNLRGSQDNLTVAVKMLKANAPASDKKDLLSELDLMKKLKPHPHVIRLLGCVTETEPLMVLIEYVPYGDLLGYLRKSRGLNDTYFKDPDMKPQTNLTVEQLMKFAWQVADGMCYLSSKKIIHRDLAARNVLVGEGEKCKVTDFGMARDVHQEDIYNKTSRGRLPVKWTAYESLMYGTYTTQSDVWSYGVVLYEILTVGGSPYPDINARNIAQKLQGGYRMPKPKHVEIKLYQIMLDCWRENPVDRPTFERLRNTMKEMERNHKTYVNLKQYDHSLYANVNDLKAM
ncbi:unnamed protein product [Porites lobata]|uniref:receptor protein-tyrosine kinase n=1 Tax=Porites lobata TaxID=104759 RepID=A0ABN8Q385_9CNID|nr:unnamed protein product [Porites lobata]